MRTIRTTLVAMTAIGGFALVSAGLTASATIFTYDQLRIDRATDAGAALSGYFVDNFDDGTPPPTGEPLLAGTNPLTNYTVNGTWGPETVGAPGKLSVDTTQGQVITSSINGNLIQRSRARLRTNTENQAGETDRNFGLKKEHRFEVSVVIDLSTLPSINGQGVGVRLEDFGGNNAGVPLNNNMQGDDVVQLSLRRSTTSSALIVGFARIDSLNGLVTNLDSVVVSAAEAAQEQIRLTLAKTSNTSDAITASYAFLTGGAGNITSTFGTTADIFNGEVHTRAALYVSTPVPEPATLGLFGLGLACLGLAARRRKTA